MFMSKHWEKEGGKSGQVRKIEENSVKKETLV